MKIGYATFSEVGRRFENQDVLKVIQMPQADRALMVVCDGMGGHEMGDVAAQVVSKSLCEYWLDNPSMPDSEQKIIEACEVASHRLYARANTTYRFIEMGTTMVMASIEGNMVTIAHCGDSRCYLLRGNEVIHQTTDHADCIPQSERVLKCFFSLDPDVSQPEVIRFEVQKGDRLFLCSDGVNKYVAPQILTDLLQDDLPLEQILDGVSFLCLKNSMDNYTGILAEIL